MRLVVNGSETSFRGATLGDLVAERKVNAEKIVLEHNGRIVHRAEWPRTVLADGDRVEIVGFVGGG